MARRKLSSGWLLRHGSQALTFDTTTKWWELDTMLGFEDIDDGAPLITRERSDYHFTRVIFWFYVNYDPAGTGNQQSVPVHVRLGVTPDDMAFEFTSAFSMPAGDASNWIRIFQEDAVMVYDAEGLPKDAVGLAVDTTPSLASSIYPVPDRMYKWDLNVKFRLSENSSLSVAWGPWVAGPGVPTTGDLYTITWAVKALLQKRE